MLKIGIHPKIVQEMLGHANISVTLDTYSHVTLNMQTDAMQEYSNFIKEKMPT